MHGYIVVTYQERRQSGEELYAAWCLGLQKPYIFFLGEQSGTVILMTKVRFNQV
jgi:hypothetical protein